MPRRNVNKRGPRDIDAEIGRRIRYYRLMKGWSQMYLGVECDLTFQQIQKYENGKNRVSASRMVDICQALEITIAKMFENITSGQIEESVSIPQIPPEIIRLAKKIHKLPLNKQRAFFTLLGTDEIQAGAETSGPLGK